MKDQLTNKKFVAEAREHCALAIRNMATGKWLAEALLRLEALAELAEERRALLQELSEQREIDCKGCAHWHSDGCDADSEYCELARLARKDGWEK